MPNIGFPELLLILVIALVVFGPKRLPEIGRTIGKSLREFRRAQNELKSELRLDLDEDDEPSFEAPTKPPKGQTGFAEAVPPAQQEAWKGGEDEHPDGSGPASTA